MLCQGGNRAVALQTKLLPICQCIVTPAPGDPCRSWASRWPELGNDPSTSDWMDAQAFSSAVIGFFSGGVRTLYKYGALHTTRWRRRHKPAGQGAAASVSAGTHHPSGSAALDGRRQSCMLIVVQGRAGGRTCTGHTGCRPREREGHKHAGFNVDGGKSETHQQKYLTKKLHSKPAADRMRIRMRTRTELTHRRRSVLHRRRWASVETQHEAPRNGTEQQTVSVPDTNANANAHDRVCCLTLGSGEPAANKLIPRRDGCHPAPAMPGMPAVPKWLQGIRCSSPTPGHRRAGDSDVIHCLSALGTRMASGAKESGRSAAPGEPPERHPRNSAGISCRGPPCRNSDSEDTGWPRWLARLVGLLRFSCSCPQGPGRLGRRSNLPGWEDAGDLSLAPTVPLLLVPG